MSEKESEFDMWEALGVPCAGYSSSIDDAMIGVLIGISKHQYCSDIAKELKLPEDYVELLQSIACSAGLAEYGTSPRGAFPKDIVQLDTFIEKCDSYYGDKWGG